MVLQYKKRAGGKRWVDYPGKNKVEGDVRDYDFRLLSHDKNKVLVEKGDYDSVMKRFRQIEFFKRRNHSNIQWS